MGYVDDLKKTQTVSAEVIERLRDLQDQYKITTGKMRAIVHEELANKVAYHEKKIEEHDQKVKEHNERIGFMARVLGNLTKRKKS